MPISPAAKKFHLCILCSALNNSIILSNWPVLCSMRGKRHIADVNQNIAEPHAVITAPVSIKDLIVPPGGLPMNRDHAARPNWHMLISGTGSLRRSRSDE
jgi:hypothetical protein